MSHCCRSAVADEGPLDPAPPKGTTTEEIIRHFAAKEKDFQQARDQYTYRQDVKVQTPEDDGEYHEIFDVLFDDQGSVWKRGVRAPVFIGAGFRCPRKTWTISGTACPLF